MLSSAVNSIPPLWTQWLLIHRAQITAHVLAVLFSTTTSQGPESRGQNAQKKQDRYAPPKSAFHLQSVNMSFLFKNFNRHSFTSISVAFTAFRPASRSHTRASVTFFAFLFFVGRFANHPDAQNNFKPRRKSMMFSWFAAEQLLRVLDEETFAKCCFFSP